MGVAVRRIRALDVAAMTDLVYDVLHLAGDRASRDPARRAAITTSTTELLTRGLLTD